MGAVSKLITLILKHPLLNPCFVRPLPNAGSPAVESVSRSPSIVLHEALASPRPSSRQASARSRGIQTLFGAIRSKSETKLQDALEGFRHDGVFVGRWLWLGGRGLLRGLRAPWRHDGHLPWLVLPRLGGALEGAGPWGGLIGSQATQLQAVDSAAQGENLLGQRCLRGAGRGM